MIALLDYVVECEESDEDRDILQTYMNPRDEIDPYEDGPYGYNALLASLRASLKMIAAQLAA
jgi:hypothetical protein